MDMWKCHTQGKQLPVPDEDSMVFWEGCRRHRLLIQQCAACDAFPKHHGIPRQWLWRQFCRQHNGHSGVDKR